ncbi:MAG: CopD family protein [Anaerolineae bacterium]|nr:CopD family protein [Anaerolineae bacterium]
MTRRILLLTVLVISGGLLSFGASAHGFLVRAVPNDRAVLERSPARVQYWFSESLEPAFSSLTVRTPSGEVIAEGGSDPDNTALLSATLPPNLPDGAYIADLRLAFASDGHVIAETRVFFVGAEVAGVGSGVETGVNVIEAVWRALTAIGLIVSFGAAGLYAWVLRPAWGSAAHPAGALPPRVMNRLTLILAVGLGLTIIVQIAALLQQAVTFFGVDFGLVLSQSLWGVVRSSTFFGQVWTARMLVVMLCAVMIAAAFINRRSQPELTRPMWSAAVWGLALALGSLSVVSHAPGSRAAAWAAVINDWAHLLTIALWVGGLIALVAVLPAALRPLDRESARKALLAALRRFSPLAAACLFIVVATGVFSASLWVRPASLVASSYGLSLLVKVALVAALIGVGALHHAALNPQRFERWAGWVDRLGGWRRTLRIEAAFGVLALVGAGWLTATPVPVPPDALIAVAPLTAEQTVDGLTVSLSISPGGPGINTYDATVTRGGVPVTGARVTIQAASPERDMRAPWSAFEPLDNGGYATVNADIDRDGMWWTLIDVTTPDGETARAAFTFDVTSDATIEAAIPLNPAQAGALVLAIAALIAALRPVWRALHRRLDLSPQAVTLVIVTLIGSGAALLAGYAFIAAENERYLDTVNPPPQIVNPTLPDAGSLGRGAVLFDSACAGWIPDSPGWEALTARLDRTRDEELFVFTRDGFRGLPPCATLTDAQRWDVVNYARFVLRTG